MKLSLKVLYPHMLIPRAIELKLLSGDLDSNILTHFPLEAKCIIIHETNHYISSNIPLTSSRFATEVHVNWVMEIIGQGFSLPIANSDIINGSVKIYAAWLLQAQTRPLAIMEAGDESEALQLFFQVYCI